MVDDIIDQPAVRELAKANNWELICANFYTDVFIYPNPIYNNVDKPAYLYVVYNTSDEADDDSFLVLPYEGNKIGFSSIDLVAPLIRHWLTTKEFLSEDEYWNQLSATEKSL